MEESPISGGEGSARTCRARAGFAMPHVLDYEASEGGSPRARDAPSGTSALAGMLQAAGVASAGPAVRNWDNARGHFESLALVRLSEAVLARSGGHWLAAPHELDWAHEHERERDRLLAEPIDGRPALLKDPRTLLVLPFWRATTVPFRALGIFRHPLAVARSLATSRGLALGEGLALWSAHNQALLADHRAHGTALVDFELPRAEFVARVGELCRELGSPVEERRLAEAHQERLVHHDGEEPESEGALAELAQALELHRELVHAAGNARPITRALAEGALERALAAARAALARTGDPAAVLVPVTSALLRARAFAPAEALLAEHASTPEPGLAALLEGKVALEAGDVCGAIKKLEAALAEESPYHQARRLLPLALRKAGRRREAREKMAELARHALYPHDPLAQLAEWTWRAGEHAAALAELARAIEAAPPHRRGRLRTLRAEWLRRTGDVAGARAELELACKEDPAYGAARAALERLERE